MRCKPNEMCIVENGPLGHGKEARPLIGSIVRTIRYLGDYIVGSRNEHVNRAWLVESSFFPDALEVVVSDDYLRPIRPPGEFVMIGQLEGLKERV